MADVDQSFTGSMVAQFNDVSRGYVGSVTVAPATLNKSYTASIDPFGTSDMAGNSIPDTGMSLDIDNLDSLTYL